MTGERNFLRFDRSCGHRFVFLFDDAIDSLIALEAECDAMAADPELTFNYENANDIVKVAIEGRERRQQEQTK